MRTLHVDFTEGMTSDIQDESTGVVKLAKHFDMVTKPRSLVPYLSQTDADGSSTTNRIRDFLYYASVDGTVPRLWGRGGADTGAGATAIYYKSDFTSNTWAATANSTIGNGSQDNVFVEYHDFFYGICTGASAGKGYVFRYDPTGAVAMDNNYLNTLGVTAIIGTIANLAGLLPRGVVHSKDDILYLATGNTIASINYNGGSPTATNPALTLPAKLYITDMCEYGNFLAIACAPYGGGKSVVYLWDRNSSLTTLSDVLDFGFGQLKIIEQVDGTLIGISLRTEVLTGIPPRLVFREYSGSRPQIFREIIASSSTGIQLEKGQKFNANRLYFGAGITIDGTLHNGVWGVARGPSNRWIVWFDRLPNNDTAVAATGMAGFHYLGDYATVAYADTAVHAGASTTGYHMSMTNNSSLYSATSIIETPINPSMPAKIRGSAGHRNHKKKLVAIDVQTPPLTSGQSVTLKYRTDSTGAYTTIVTDSTIGSVTRESMVDSSGNPFTDGREFQFRIESTGGATINSLVYKYEELETNI